MSENESSNVRKMAYYHFLTFLYTFKILKIKDSEIFEYNLLDGLKWPEMVRMNPEWCIPLKIVRLFFHFPDKQLLVIYFVKVVYLFLVHQC